MATTTRTADHMALNILLAGGPRMQNRLTALASRCHDLLHGGACPECGNHGPHDDNGASGHELVFLCLSCGHQWGVESL